MTVPDPFAPVAFFAFKGVAYLIWCRLGVGWLSASLENRWSKAFLYAGLRLTLGLIFGAALTWSIGRAHPGAWGRMGIPPLFGSWIWTYLLAFGLLRFVAWGLVAYLMSQKNRFRWRKTAWTAAGVALSFITDAAGFAMAVTLVGGIC